MKLSKTTCASLGALLLLQVITSAHALTRVDDLTDVKPDHWATPAIGQLVDKEVVEGYPNKTFKGNKPATRNEMAVVLSALLNSIDRDLSKVDKNKADQREVQVLSQLQQQLSGYISTLGQDVKTVQNQVTQADGIIKDQNRRLGLLEKTQIHGDSSLGILSDMGTHGKSGQRNGIRDAATSIGRLRLTVDAPVVEDNPDSKLGSGVLHARLLGAFGRYAPIGAKNGGNTDYPFNLYSRVSTDASGFNEGYGTGSVGSLYGLNGNTLINRPNVYIESLFYSQHFKSGIPLLTDLGLNGRGDKWKASGDLFAGLARWWDLFDVSPYRGNEMAQFQNNAFINIPGNAVNIPQTMAGYQWHQGLGSYTSADISTAVGSLDSGDLGDGLNATYEAKLNYNLGFLGDKFNRPGSVYAGGYNIFQTGNRRYNASISTLTNRAGGVYSPSLSNKSTGNALYLGWNQEWWKGIGTNISYLNNNNSTNIIAATTLQPGPAKVAGGAKQSLSAVMQVPLSVFGNWRKQDTIGLGYAFVDIYRGGVPASFKTGLESVLEAYYKFQINDSFAIIPSAQLLFNPLGVKNNGNTVVLGLRMSHTF